MVPQQPVSTKHSESEFLFGSMLSSIIIMGIKFGSYLAFDHISSMSNKFDHIMGARKKLNFKYNL